MKSPYPSLPKNTMVTITRRVIAFPMSDPMVHGPKTLAQAFIDNDFTTSSGTVAVTAEVADGPHEGATVIRDEDGHLRAWYDPAHEYPDRSPLEY
jgi:hypothetical protein